MEPSVEKRIKDSFARQTAMATIGASVAGVERGEVTIELPFRSDLTQQHGFLHAGVVTMIVDTACGYAAMTQEDLGCAISGHTYGWEPADKDGATRFLAKMNYASDSEAANTILQSMRTLKPGQCEAVVYSPLERTKIEPDVILMYLNPVQLMRCLHGSTYHSGKPIACSFSGMAASCTEGVIAALLDQSPKVVVPGPATGIGCGQPHRTTKWLARFPHRI